jgi:aminopeptidase N
LFRRHVAALSGVLIASIAFAPAATAGPSGAGSRAGHPGRPGERGKPPRPSHKPGAGARSAGDRLFPQIGNGGYDALHYDLVLGYDPATDVLQGRATMTARATKSLTEFSLDLQGFSVSGVSVNGKPATFTREDTKLIVDPKNGTLPSGKTFTVQVAYSGVPAPITDPDGSQEGWFATDDGAFVVGEPIGSQGWFPNNNTPRDKATFDATTTVPAGITVVGNGTLVGSTTSAGETTWHWREQHQMATYLATATLGHFDVTTRTTPRGVTVFDAVDPLLTPAQKARAAVSLGKEPAIVESHTSLYGPYPFNWVGAAVDRAPTVGYALESQSISNYPGAPSSGTLAHEIAHQWFGNAVTPVEWVDIWLNEGFAEWIQWDWSARADGGDSTAALWDENYARPETDPVWRVPPANPQAEELFDEATYTRGAMTLEGLRQIVGDPAFFRVMRQWQAEHRYGNVTTADFTALAERVSGRELTAYFQDWLYESGKPTITPANFSG